MRRTALRFGLLIAALGACLTAALFVANRNPRQVSQSDRSIPLLECPGFTLTCSGVTTSSSSWGVWTVLGTKGEQEARVVLRDVTSSDFEAGDQSLTFRHEAEARVVEVEVSATGDFPADPEVRALEREILNQVTVSSGTELNVKWPESWKQEYSGAEVTVAATVGPEMYSGVEAESDKPLEGTEITRISWSRNPANSRRIMAPTAGEIALASLDSFVVTAQSSTLSFAQTQAFADSLVLSKTVVR